MFDYHQIKVLAKDLGRPVTELIALAPNNDPFYVGTPTHIAKAAWFEEQWRATGFSRAHLRRIHYWCVSKAPMMPNGLPYENTESCWNYLIDASKKARYMDLVPISNITDHKNPEPHIFAKYRSEEIGFWLDLPELSEPGVFVRGAFEAANVQPYHLEVWFEKSTMNDVLLPICRRYSANLVTGEGEMSITQVNDLIARLHEADRPARIFYGSDFDPAGQSMPRATARKLEWMIYKSGFRHEVKLSPLVLTVEQVRHYNLPRTPIKDSERRAASFEEQHGQGAVELDALEALHPGVLKSIVVDALDAYYDEHAAQQARRLEDALEREIRQKVELVTARYAEQIQALDAMRDELMEISIADPDRFQPVRSAMTVDEPEWLFDSSRGYLEQIECYRR